MSRICFNLFDAHSVFFPRDSYAFGGAEVRAVTIANQLAKSDDVYVIIKEHEKPIDIVVNKVRVISHEYFAPNQRSILKKVYYSLIYNLQFKEKISKDRYYQWRPYLNVNAEFYAAFEITETSKMLVDFCKAFNKKFVLFIASDGELSYDTGLAKIMNVNKALAAYIVENAYKVFVQNNYQLEKLFENFKVTGIQVNNPLPLNIKETIVKTGNKEYVTWIGKSSAVKQPLLFIELAKQFPELKFCMVMNKNDESIYTEVLKNLPKNVVFKESLPFLEVNELLNNSKLFVNTSLYEGFPNTFLQAGCFSVPVISLNVNPNHFLDLSSGGICCYGSVDQLKSAVQNLIMDKVLYESMSGSISKYIAANHSVDSVVTKIATHLNILPN
ncbi:MAG: glycosyltransferase [Bacteroidia bacterium]|nr:glycosyltransferase [Bacteroidia bacterium]